MPVMPDKTALGEYRAPLTSTLQISVPADHVGTELKRFGSEAAQMGGQLEHNALAQQKFEAELGLVKHEDALRVAYDDAQKRVAPGAPNFGNQIREQTYRLNNEYFKTVPAPLRGEYATKLAALEARYATTARSVEEQQAVEAVKETVNNGLNPLITRIGQAKTKDDLFNEHDVVLERAKTIINNSPFTPVQRDVALRNFQTEALKTKAARLAAIDPNAAVAAMGLDEAAATPPADIKGKANVAVAGPVWGDPSSSDFATNHLTKVTTSSGKEVTVNKYAAQAFQGFINELEASGYKIDSIGGYNYRNKVGGGGLSQHAFGNALDINPGNNPFMKGASQAVTDMPPIISEMAARYGLSWGGDWKSSKDAMHFEYTGQGGGVRGDPRFAMLSLADRQAIVKAAQQNIKATAYDEERAVKLKDEAAKRIDEATRDEYLKRFHSDKETLTATQIANDPNLKPTTKEHLINLFKLSKADRDTASYGPAFVDLFQKVHAEQGDPERITDITTLFPRVGKDLTFSGMMKLREEISGRRTPEGAAEAEMRKQFFANAKGQITGSNEGLHLKDPKGDEKYLAFMTQANAAYEAGRKAGKSPAELLNPDSKDYIGKSIKDFKRPMSEWFNDTIRDAPAAAPPQAFNPQSVKSLDELVKAHQSGMITAATARAIAIDRGWAGARPPAPTVPISQ